MIDNAFSFIEAPVYQGQKNFGTALGPAFIRQLLFQKKLNFQILAAEAGQSVDCLQFKIYEELSYLVEREIRRTRPVFVAGGDHSLSIGSVQGALRCDPNLKVLWVDAHGDINTKSTSPTGALHGMPLAFLLGAETQDGEHWMGEKLKPENLIYFGVRDLDSGEKEFLDKKKIKYYTAAQIQQDRSSQILREIVTELRGCNVLISVDSDAFDPLLAPSTGVPVHGGLDFLTVRSLLRAVQACSQILAFEYVELNPQIFSAPDDVYRTAQIGVELFCEILNNPKQKESYHGLYDRHGYPTRTDLLHTAF